MGDVSAQASTVVREVGEAWAAAGRAQQAGSTGGGGEGAANVPRVEVRHCGQGWQLLRPITSGGESSDCASGGSSGDGEGGSGSGEWSEDGSDEDGSVDPQLGICPPTIVW